MTTDKPQDELRQLIIKALNGLDWSQAEFGYLPSDDDFADAIEPVVRQWAISMQPEKVDKNNKTWLRFHAKGYNKALDDYAGRFKPTDSTKEGE